MSEKLQQLTRRRVLQLSALGALGSGVSGWFGPLSQAAEQAGPGKKQRACILLWMNGGPSQAHTFDIKDDGEFKTIDTTAPGIKISEYLPQMAQRMKDVALIRSMSTGENVHERARFLMHTGYRQAGSQTYPAVGCITSSEIGSPDAELPNFVAIDGGVDGNNAGGAFRSNPSHLGPRHAPLVVTDPSKGVENLKPFVGLDELDERAALLDRAEKRFAERYDGVPTTAHRATYQRALRLLHSDRARAFDLDRESTKVRETYGDTQFGRGCLLARRLVESGVPFVEVTLGGWDDHGGAAKPIARRSPYMDTAMAALLGDLQQRGLLDSTLVIWMGEFGRSPGNGNGHFARAWTTMLAGCGVKGGRIIGRTSKKGDTVEERPVTAPDFIATVCTALGIDFTKEFTTRDGRPVRLADKTAQPVRELFS